MKSWLKLFVHNCLVHPLLPFLPEKFAYKLHEMNGKWAFCNSKPPEESSEARGDL